MGNWIEKLLDQLVSRVWQLLAGKVAARIELELMATQAELLEHAATWRREHGELGEAVARRLESASEKLGAEVNGVADRFLEQNASATKAAARLNPETGEPVDAAGKRPRGRPRKEIELEPALQSSQTLFGIGEAKGEFTS